MLLYISLERIFELVGQAIDRGFMVYPQEVHKEMFLHFFVFVFKVNDDIFY